METPTIDIVIDFESTGINPYVHEPITGFMLRLDNGEFHHFRSQVREWKEDAELIHGISEKDTLLFDDKKTAFRKLLKWLPQNFRFISYVNRNTELGVINYDVALMVNELNLLGCPNYYLENKYNMKPPISVHDMAKKAAKLGLFVPEKKNGRVSFTQENVYYALFGERYKSHDSREDTIALARIYRKLDDLIHEDRILF